MQTTTDFPTEPGCYVDGHRGHYAGAYMLMVLGNETQAQLGREYHRTPDTPDHIIDEVIWETDALEQTLNDHAPADHAWFWQDGDFGLWTTTEEE